MTQSFARRVATKSPFQASGTEHGHRTSNSLSLPLPLPLSGTSWRLLRKYRQNSRPSPIPTIPIPYRNRVSLFTFDPADPTIN